MNPFNQSTTTIRALLFTCLLAMMLAACAPGSTVSPTVISTSTAMHTLTSTVTPMPSLTFPPVPTIPSTPTPRPIVECVNCQIIYTSNVGGIFQIYKMSEDGSNPVNITPPGKGQAYDFAWSPDGTRIAFVANRSGSSDSYNEIYVMNADGSHVVNLTQNQVYDSSPVWSPDGTRIAFISQSEDIHDKNSYLYVTLAPRASAGVNADGSHPIRAAKWLVDTPPAWSPDGSKIAYLARMSENEQLMALNIINADGSYFGGGFPIGFVSDYLPGSSFAWSPDSRQIVFQTFKGTGIYLYSVDTDMVTNNLTRNYARFPAWSPDGKRIAFVSRSSTDKDEISVMNADGSNVTPLTPNSNWDDVFQLTWSPGGSKLVFVARQGKNEQIYRVNADGSNLTPLSKDKGVAFRQIAWTSSPVSGPDAAATKPPSALAESCDKFAFVSADVGMGKYAPGTLFVKNIDGSDMFPLSNSVGWSLGGFSRIVGSPDGRSLAFDNDSSFITVSNVETLDFVEIRDDAYPRINEPAWSPDGRRIAFSFEKNGALEIGVTNAAGGAITNLTRNPADDQKPAWSPDGRKIAFLSARDGVISDLYVMNANGSNVTRLTQDLFVESFPVWSPDGSKIAFSDNNDIYVVNADGSGLNNLTFNSAKNNSPVWSPDGLKIAFRAYVSPQKDTGNVPKDGLQSLIVLLNPLGRYFSPQNNEKPPHSGVNAEIFVMNADGSNVLNLTKHPANDNFPVWSPDGSKILFQTDRDGKPQIYMTLAPRASAGVDADGSNPTNLTNCQDSYCGSPVWIPCLPSN